MKALGFALCLMLANACALAHTRDCSDDPNACVPDRVGTTPNGDSASPATRDPGSATSIDKTDPASAARPSLTKPAASSGGVAAQPDAGSGSHVTERPIDKIDLLFVVDNSNSMADKQDALKVQLPKLISMLTSGERSSGDPNPFPFVRDLHVGVVSTDMGVPGVTGLAGCDPDGGDDARLQHKPKPGADASCMPNYPAFLSYSEGLSGQPDTDRKQFANDFQCIATLGSGGCGFEEQLEAPLKALWPSVYVDAKGNVVTPNPVTFLSTTPAGTLGRGDVPVERGGNLGFLRNDPAQGLSLIAIILLTDEEDCSPRTTEHLKPPEQYPPNTKYAQEDINLRCFLHPELSYDVRNRYYNGLRLLRPGHENTVVFAAITGVPPDLVNSDARGPVDFSDATSRDAYYDTILNDPRMQEAIDQSSHPGTGSGNLSPSCSGTDAAGHTWLARPPRRIVKLAQLFGSQGIVQSICDSDFGPATDAIVSLIGERLAALRR